LQGFDGGADLIAEAHTPDKEINDDPVSQDRQMPGIGRPFLGNQTLFWNPKWLRQFFEHETRFTQSPEKTHLCTHSLGLHQWRLPRKAQELFVATKRSGREWAVQKEGRALNMPYVTSRWLGRLLTECQTIRKSIKRRNELDEMARNVRSTCRGKKEAHMLLR